MISNQTRCLYGAYHIQIKRFLFSLVLDDDDTLRLESHVSSLIRAD